jgi:hypothetical protein
MPSSGISQPSSMPVERPPCPKCSEQMMLARIEPDQPGHDKRTFECLTCECVETIVVKYK